MGSESSKAEAPGGYVAECPLKARRPTLLFPKLFGVLLLELISSKTSIPSERFFK